MTLVEVLVAMSVLLVGIWGVAAGFPRLLGAVRDEGRRTQMTRLAEATLARLIADPSGLPQMIAGDPNLSPYAVPIDPDDLSLGGNPLNGRDDVLQVTGERGVIPALQGNGAVGVVYPLKVGRANPLGAFTVSEVVSLTALDQLPPNPQLADGTFFLKPDGSFVLPASLQDCRLLVSYAWRDNSGGVHFVQRETVNIAAGVGSVAAAGSGNTAFGGIVEGSYSGELLNGFIVNPPGQTVLAGQVSPDPAGAVLIFNAADAGRRIQVDYTLQVEAGSTRRAREIWEDQVLSSASATPDGATGFSFVNVQLSATGLASAPNATGRDPLVNFAPTPGPNPPQVSTHVLAVDLATGQNYYEGTGIDQIDYARGRIRLRVSNTAPSPLGHPLRFFYHTENDGMLTVLRAPEWFLPGDIIGISQPGLSYLVTKVGTATVLDFASGLDPVSSQAVSTSAGSMVSVDYLRGDATNPQRVMGELHTIPVSANGGQFPITLNQTDVLSVVAVRGASLRVRAWWRAENGRQQFVDVDTLVPGAPAS
jgi:hypothetical protein